MRIFRLPLCLFIALFITASARPQDVFTPVVASPLPSSVFPFEGTDNKQHFVYELVITNTGDAPATIQKLEVVNSDDPSQVLASFEGDSLLSHLRTAGRGSENPAQIEFSGTRLFLVDFTTNQQSSPPSSLSHRFQLQAAGSPGAPKNTTIPYTYTIAPIKVSTAITVLGPPLSGKGWVALNGCCEPGGVHRSTGLPVNGRIYFSQRFAIDWMQLSPDARFFHGDEKSLTSYAFYGAKVLAVADGTVVETISSLDDQTPGTLPDPKTINIENVDGNHIVIDLGSGKYAFYAHLQKNSLLVSKGAHVKRGQVLALLGNTGNTSAPHMHFHLMDGSSVLGSSGLPYVIDHFELAGQLSSEQFKTTEIQGEWSKNLLPHPSSRKSELPLDLTVIDF